MKPNIQTDTFLLGITVAPSNLPTLTLRQYAIAAETIGERTHSLAADR